MSKLSAPARVWTASWSLGSWLRIATAGASPVTSTPAAADPAMSIASTPLVALTITRSVSPSPPPPMADRSLVNSVTSVPLRSSTVVVSAPASERTMTASTSSRSIVIAAMSRVSRTRPPFADTAIFSPIAEPLKRSVVAPGLALERVAAVARVPLHRVVAGPGEDGVVALVAVEGVVAVAAEQTRRRRCRR